MVAQLVKSLPAMQETWAQSLGWEDPLEEEMATHSSILAWRIPPGSPGESGLVSRPIPMTIELVMPSNHLILCHSLLLLPSIFPASGSFLCFGRKVLYH